MDMGLTNRSVIVCASSDGIARAAADKFAGEGARVAIVLARCDQTQAGGRIDPDATRHRSTGRAA
jgi:NAD(P)-dependent dehydrogenase (short-subunit alcohol dehydrogenase family)